MFRTHATVFLSADNEQLGSVYTLALEISRTSSKALDFLNNEVTLTIELLLCKRTVYVAIQVPDLCMNA